jgi:hypothetical protein
VEADPSCPEAAGRRAKTETTPSRAAIASKSTLGALFALLLALALAGCAKLQSDPVTEPNPVSEWRGVSDAFDWGTCCFKAGEDPLISYHATGGDPHPDIRGIVHHGYRTLKIQETKLSASQSLPRSTLNVQSTAGFPTSGHLWIEKRDSYTQVTYAGKGAQRFTGVSGGSGTPPSGSRVVSQSEWDFYHQRDSTRTQLINQSCSNTFYCYKEGTRSLTCMGVRLQTRTPLPYNVGPGGGNTKYSQVWQIKEGHPILSMLEGRDGLKLVNNYNEGQRVKEYFFRDLPRGKWLRLCIDIRFDSDPSNGAFRLWGDINGDSNYRRYLPLTEKITAPTLNGGDDHAMLSIGPYNHVTLPSVSRDYANVEVLGHPPSDPWGG